MARGLRAASLAALIAALHPAGARADGVDGPRTCRIAAVQGDHIACMFPLTPDGTRPAPGAWIRAPFVPPYTVLSKPPADPLIRSCKVSAAASGTLLCTEILPIDPAGANANGPAAHLSPGAVISRPYPHQPADSVDIDLTDLGAREIAVALAGGIALGLCFALIVAGGPRNLPSLVVGKDNRLSNSKLQAVAWMGLLFVAYTTTALLRLMAGLPWQNATDIGLPNDLLAIASVSAAAAGGAKITTGAKAALAAPGEPRKTIAAAPALKDLFMNDGSTDLPDEPQSWDIGDAQMILVAFAALVIFAWNLARFWSALPATVHVDLPEPTTALTFAFGGSMGAYLAKKIGGTVGES